MPLDIVLGFSFFSFHADLKRKGPLIFGYLRQIYPPIRTKPLRLCACLPQVGLCVPQLYK